MSALRVEIACDNAAFHEADTGTECARILTELAEKLERGQLGGNLYDFNGNKVGRWSLETDDGN